MTVYVDPLRPCVRSAKWPWYWSCHLFADTRKELHEFARRLGLRPGWFQDRIRFPHYDLTWGKRRYQGRSPQKAEGEEIMYFLFDDPYETIEEGPVKIQFEKSNEHVKVTCIIDFAKTSLAPHQAANVQKAIVAALRTGLGVQLSKFK